jgi:hypothetical protein
VNSQGKLSYFFAVLFRVLHSLDRFHARRPSPPCILLLQRF